jgi:hypothetical protein
MGLTVSDADGIHRPHSSALPLTRGSEPSRPTASGLWTVFHTDGDGAGLMSRKFATEAEARAATKRWNKTYPGHIVIPPNVPRQTAERSGASLQADDEGSMDTRAAGREAHEMWERTRGDENECDAERRFREDAEHSTEWWNGWMDRSDEWRDENGGG